MSVSMLSLRMPSAASVADWMPRVTEATLVVAMAWVVSGWFTGGTMPRAPSPAPGMAGPAAMPSVPTIAAVPLFGVSAPAVAQAAAVAQSHLSIQLLGTVVAGRKSAAVLALHAGAKQKVFVLGQAIEAGVILKAVEPAAVVVDNHGHSERIAMVKPVLVSAPSPSSRAAGDQARIDISRAGLDAQLHDLPRLLTEARATQHQRGGKPDGIMIDDIVPGSLYARAGLKDGDVIRSVNGHPLMRMDQGIRLFQSMKGQRHIDIEIARGGGRRLLHYVIR